MSRLLRKTRSSGISLPVVTLTPLIDTVLVLLVVFMITTPGKVASPPINAHATDAVKYDKHVAVTDVFIDGTDKLWINNEAVDTPLLTERIRQAPKNADITAILLRYDKKASRASITRILDVLRQEKGVGIIIG